MKRALQKLCETAGNELELFESLPYRQAIIVIKLTFEQGFSPDCQWKLFQNVLSCSSNDLLIPFLFARSAAISPSDASMLRLAVMRLSSVKHGKLGTKRLLFDFLLILQQQESELSSSIKKSLKHMRAQSDRIRSQIRHVWESLHRVNLDDLEELSGNLKSSQTGIVYDFDHLCLIYPNNTFVAHAYSRFMGETVKDIMRAAKMTLTEQLIRTGRQFRVGQCSYFATHLFPTLPDNAVHSAIIGVRTEIESSAVDEKMAICHHIIKATVHLAALKIIRTMKRPNCAHVLIH
jgi:hypothetical protein